MPRRLILAIAAAFFVFGLSGCADEGPAERAGEEIDEVAEETRESAEEVTEEAGEAAEEAGESMEESLEEAEEENEALGGDDPS